tara:strand:+ start:16 stop:591 length:576 start_codon:yes stop_codon:yes gene_type:complete
MIIKKNKIKNALEQLRKGNIIIYPTDTIYGFGVDATNPLAIRKLNILKGRQAPLSIMIKSVYEIEKYASITNSEFNLIKKILPGSFTLLLKAKSSNLSSLVQQKSKKIGIRVPNNKFCLELLAKFKKPIITTSVNVHGYKSLNNIDEIEEKFVNINTYLGNINNNSNGSTILDFMENKVKIIRQGDGIFNL